MFDFVDDVSTCDERFCAVTCAYAHPHGHLSDREVSDAVYAGSMLDAESGDCLLDNALTLLDGQRLERLVFEVTNGETFIVIANPAFEGRVTARSGVKQPRAKRGIVDFLAAKAECSHAGATLN